VKKALAGMLIVVLLIALILSAVLLFQFSNNDTPIPLPLFGRSVAMMNLQDGCPQELSFVIDKQNHDDVIRFYDSELQSRGWHRSGAKRLRTSLITYRKFWDVRSKDTTLELYIQERDAQTLYVQMLRC
jgi:hypothetical protein